MSDQTPQGLLRGWAKAYRDTPEHRFPSDPHAEFFPVDLEFAADEIDRLRGELDRSRGLFGLVLHTEAGASPLPPASRASPCSHAPIIGLDGKWHCQKCGDAIEMATAQSPAHSETGKP